MGRVCSILDYPLATSRVRPIGQQCLQNWECDRPLISSPHPKRRLNVENLLLQAMDGIQGHGLQLVIGDRLPLAVLKLIGGR